MIHKSTKFTCIVGVCLRETAHDQDYLQWRPSVDIQKSKCLSSTNNVCQLCFENCGSKPPSSLALFASSARRQMQHTFIRNCRDVVLLRSEFIQKKRQKVGGTFKRIGMPCKALRCAVRFLSLSNAAAWAKDGFDIRTAQDASPFEFTSLVRAK